MTDRVLYLPSTPFNLLVSLLDIRQRKPEQAQLIMIDQREPVEYLSVLKTYKNFSLQRVEALQAAQGFFKPIKRRKHFNKLWEWVSDFRPNEIVVGSDRRIEFQYLMYRFKKERANIKGVYLDDGLFSYLDWPNKPVSKFFDSLIKKIAYGLWWHQPDQVGDSSWIDEVRLFSPEMARSSLKTREVSRIEGRYLLDKEVKELSKKIMKYLSVDVGVFYKAKKVILVPHPHNLDKLPELKNKIFDVMNGSQDSVLVKYHPRFDGEDALNLGSQGGYILPDKVAFEFFLPLLNDQVEVIGDLTTALLSTRWMRPDLKVMALGQMDGRFDQELLRLYKCFGVEIYGV